MQMSRLRQKGAGGKKSGGNWNGFPHCLDASDDAHYLFKHGTFIKVLSRGKIKKLRCWEFFYLKVLLEIIVFSGIIKI